MPLISGASVINLNLNENVFGGLIRIYSQIAAKRGCQTNKMISSEDNQKYSNYIYTVYIDKGAF